VKSSMPLLNIRVIAVCRKVCGVTSPVVMPDRLSARSNTFRMF